MFSDFKVAVIDIDGTLVDLDDFHVESYVLALKQFAGITIRDKLEVKRLFGLPDEKILENFLEQYHKPFSSGLIRQMQEFRTHLFESSPLVSPACVLPGVHRFLQRLGAAGVVLTCATGNSHQVGTTILRRTGLLDRFKAAAFSDEVPGKPRHEIVKLAVAKAVQLIRKERGKRSGFRVAKNEILVVGDTPFDILAAKELGVRSLAVATGNRRLSELREHHPSYFFESFDAIRLKRIQRVSRQRTSKPRVKRPRGG